MEGLPWDVEGSGGDGDVQGVWPGGGSQRGDPSRQGPGSLEPGSRLQPSAEDGGG